MKYVFLMLCFLVSTNTIAQNSTENIYFPQQQLVHPDCTSEEDTNACLKRILYRSAKPIVDTAIEFRGNNLPDTLKLKMSFVVDKQGAVIEDSFWSTLNDSILRIMIEDSLDAQLAALPRFEIKNKKPEGVFPRHSFDYHFKKNDKTNELIEIGLKPSLKYEGGDIFEAPLFKGCERLRDAQNRQCFQRKMQQHIKENFRYPRKAQRRGIEGKVYVMFKIGKDGSVQGIRTKGPSPLLEEEAARIISLLPKPAPGLMNGKKVRVPFSIPITFRLQ